MIKKPKRREISCCHVAASTKNPHLSGYFHFPIIIRVIFSNQVTEGSNYERDSRISESAALVSWQHDTFLVGHRLVAIQAPRRKMAPKSGDFALCQVSRGP